LRAPRGRGNERARVHRLASCCAQAAFLPLGHGEPTCLLHRSIVESAQVAERGSGRILITSSIAATMPGTYNAV